METEKQRERLVELLRKSGASFERALPEEIADYLLANNVVVLPCKEGSTVHVIKREDTECHLGVIPSDFACQGCEELECDSVSTYRIRELNNINKWTILDYLWQGRFGKDVFVERAEAEKAVAEKNNV